MATVHEIPRGRTDQLQRLRSIKGRLDPTTISISAGFCAGIAEAVSCHPFDTIKVGMQTLRSSPELMSQGIRPSFTGVTARILRSQGPIGLYTGLSPVITFMGPKLALRFTSFETFKKLMTGDDGKLSALGALQCGLGAGIVEAAVIVTPMEVVKIKMQSRQTEGGQLKYRSFVQTIVRVIQESGIKGLYNGLALTAARQSTNQAASFGTYTALRSYLEKQQDGAPLAGWKTALIGFAAGAAAPSANTPLDTIKTRLQRSTPIAGQSEFQRAKIILVDCVRNEGVAALYRGCLPRVLRAAPAQAITFSVYETVKGFLSA